MSNVVIALVLVTLFFVTIIVFGTRAQEKAQREKSIKRKIIEGLDAKEVMLYLKPNVYNQIKTASDALNVPLEDFIHQAATSAASEVILRKLYEDTNS